MGKTEYSRLARNVAYFALSVMVPDPTAMTCLRLAGTGQQLIQAVGRDSWPFPDEFSHVAKRLESAKDAFTQGRPRPLITDHAERLARVNSVNELRLRAFQGVRNDNGFHRNGLLRAGVRVVPSPCNQLADDTRKITCLFHGFVLFCEFNQPSVNGCASVINILVNVE